MLFVYFRFMGYCTAERLSAFFSGVMKEAVQLLSSRESFDWIKDKVKVSQSCTSLNQLLWGAIRFQSSDCMKRHWGKTLHRGLFCRNIDYIGPAICLYKPQYVILIIAWMPFVYRISVGSHSAGFLMTGPGLRINWFESSSLICWNAQRWKFIWGFSFSANIHVSLEVLKMALINPS